MNTPERYDPHAPVPCDSCSQAKTCTTECKPFQAWASMGDSAEAKRQQAREYQARKKSRLTSIVDRFLGV